MRNRAIGSVPDANKQELQIRETKKNLRKKSVRIKGPNQLSKGHETDLEAMRTRAAVAGAAFASTPWHRGIFGIAMPEAASHGEARNDGRKEGEVDGWNKSSRWAHEVRLDEWDVGKHVCSWISSPGLFVDEQG